MSIGVRPHFLILRKGERDQAENEDENYVRLAG
jgi:hypothetical protein